MTTLSKMRQRGARTDAIPTEAVFGPSRAPVKRNMNDPAVLYTYAATPTLPGASRGLIAMRIIGPDSPIADEEYIGEYLRGENLTTANFLTLHFRHKPGQADGVHDLISRGHKAKVRATRKISVPAWPPSATTYVTTAYTTASGRYVRIKRASSFGWLQ